MEFTMKVSTVFKSLKIPVSTAMFDENMVFLDYRLYFPSVYNFMPLSVDKWLQLAGFTYFVRAWINDTFPNHLI